MTELLATLDDASAVERLDVGGLRFRIAGLPDDCEAAWQRHRSLELPGAYTSVREVVLAGMGGSAIAADMLRSLAAAGSRKPVHVVRGYDLPAFVDDASLVVACSHSGNTEETLSAYEQAVARGAPTVVVAKGGPLLELARAAGAPGIVYEYDGSPRSAIGHQLMALVAIGERVGLLGAQSDAVAEAVTLLREQRARLDCAVPAEGNPAKQLAGRLFGRLPVVVGAGPLAVAAYRWKTQLNENSKSWALFEEAPELGHNSIVGFGLPKAVVAQLHVVLLSHAALPRRLLLHYDATAEALRDAGVANERVDALGTSTLAQILTGAYHGDWVSFHLAILNGVDPSPVAPITKLKQRLRDG
jgi:glucose/mannose-6-phosphate isomerase